MNNMSLYESTFIIRHDMSTQQVEQLAESFSDIIKNNGGDVPKTEHWGLKTLAYRINKNRKGHYVFFNLDAPSAAVQEYERNLRLSEDVLRYLTVRVDELDPEPSPMMQVRASRDERSRRSGPPHDSGGSSATAEDKKPGAAEAATDTKTAAKDATAPDKPAEDKPAEDKPAAEKPAEETTAAEPKTDESGEKT
jgi:small subunit ribosomal protein S6